MSQIFFSYSRKDSEFVDQLIERLETYGADIWVDRGEILAGEAWRRIIVEAIIDSQVFVIVLSPNSIASENVTKELTLAEQYDKRVMPLVIQEVKIPPSLDYQLAGLHYQTFAEGDYEENFERLLRSLVSSGIEIQSKPEPEPEKEATILEPDPDIAAITSEPDIEPVIAAATLAPDFEPPVQEQTKGTLPQTSRMDASLPSASSQKSNPLQKIPIWLWAGGGLVAIIGLIIILSGALSRNNPDVDLTVTEENALVLSTETTEPTSIAPTATEEIALVVPIETPELTLTPFPPLISDEFGISMVLVPAGSFLMGAEEEDPDEAPVREIVLDDFYIDQFETSIAHYKKCVEAGACSHPSKFESDTLFSYYDNDAFSNYPVIYVSWEDASAYCQWRGARLPTEAEWEKAARGTEVWRYPWGNQFDPSRANYCGGSTYCPNEPDDGFIDTAPVNSFEAGVSPFGAYHLAGNVNEWVADWYAEDYFSTLNDGDENPQGPATGQDRVIRGGSFGLNAGKLRVTNRGHAFPQLTEQYNGFRCAVDSP